MMNNDIRIQVSVSDHFEERTITSVEPNEVLKTGSDTSFYFGKLTTDEVQETTSKGYVSSSDRSLINSIVPIGIANQTVGTLSCDVNFCFNISISSNITLTTNNVIVGKCYYLFITNTSSSTSYTITLPSNRDRKPRSLSTGVITLSSSSTVELSFMDNGNYRYWQVSEELV